MLLDLSRFRTGVERLDRQFEPAAMTRADDAFRVVGPVRLGADLRKDGQKVRLIGRVEATLELECSRCLEPFEVPIDAAVDALLLPASENAGEGEHEVAADDLGVFIVTFAAPRSKGGDPIVTASDGTNTAEITYTVESTPPSVPPPLKPEMGLKAKSPVTLDWEDVTDDSRPVIYTLQIATDNDFGEKDIVLEKTDLEKSTYVLTEAEELKLAGEETSYFWRVRAVDGASNASEWTGAGKFSIAAPFSFSGWPLYTILGIGAVFIFLIGYWLGRRAAWSY